MYQASEAEGQRGGSLLKSSGGARLILGGFIRIQMFVLHSSLRSVCWLTHCSVCEGLEEESETSGGTQRRVQLSSL